VTLSNALSDQLDSLIGILLKDFKVVDAFFVEKGTCEGTMQPEHRTSVPGNLRGGVGHTSTFPLGRECYLRENVGA